MEKLRYRGQLLGGPDHGNFVTSSVPIISVLSKTELGLDELQISVTITSGQYIWQPKGEYFLWKLGVSNYFSKEKLE